MLINTAAMSSDALDRLIKEVQALTPDEQRQLIDRLAAEKLDSQEPDAQRSGSLEEAIKDMATDFEDTEHSQLNTHSEERQNSATLGEWLNETRARRAELPLTSDSVNILRELRDTRSKQ